MLRLDSTVALPRIERSPADVTPHLAFPFARHRLRWDACAQLPDRPIDPTPCTSDPGGPPRNRRSPHCSRISIHPATMLSPSVSFETGARSRRSASRRSTPTRRSRSASSFASICSGSNVVTAATYPVSCAPRKTGAQNHSHRSFLLREGPRRPRPAFGSECAVAHRPRTLISRRARWRACCPVNASGSRGGRRGSEACHPPAASRRPP